MTAISQTMSWAALPVLLVLMECVKPGVEDTLSKDGLGHPVLLLLKEDLCGDCNNGECLQAAVKALLSQMRYDTAGVTWPHAHQRCIHPDVEHGSADAEKCWLM